MMLAGIQCVLWALSGLYMVSFDIHTVHGEHLINVQPATIETPPAYPVDRLLSDYPSAQQLRLDVINDTKVFRFVDEQNVTRVLDAETGKPVAVVSETTAEEIAKQAFHAPYPVRAVKQINDPQQAPSELSIRHLPVWAVEFEHWSQPTLYINQYSGEVVTVRHAIWRLFDLLWRLHIMDYDDGENIGNGLLQGVAGVFFVAVVAGIWLAYKRTTSKPYRVRPRLSKFHTVLGIVVSVQLLLWLGSGLTLSLMASLEHNPSRDRAHSPINLSESTWPDIPWAALELSSAQQIEFKQLLGKPYLYVQRTVPVHANQPRDAALLDAATGLPIEITSAFATTIANRAYEGQGKAHVTWFEQPPLDTVPGYQNAVWVTQFNDEARTRVVVDAVSGNVISFTDRLSSLKDWMMRLHFMDYRGPMDFHHPLIITFAVVTLLLSLTGLWSMMGVLRLRLGKGVMSGRRYRIDVSTGHSADSTAIKLVARHSLFDGLMSRGIAVPSACGGGGTCGQCRFQTEDAVSISANERVHLSETALQKGIRLCCQHWPSEVTEIRVWPSKEADH